MRNGYQSIVPDVWFNILIVKHESVKSPNTMGIV